MTFDLKKHVITGAILAGMWPSLANSGCNADITAEAPIARYTVAGELVSDTYTGLMWKKCSEGLSGSDCATGAAVSLSWQDALKRVATVNSSGSLGHSDWRLPNRNELASLVERQCVSPAINFTIFPGTPAQGFWTSTPYALNGILAWNVGFDVGDVAPLPKTALRSLRLVRAGP